LEQEIDAAVRHTHPTGNLRRLVSRPNCGRGAARVHTLRIGYAGIMAGPTAIGVAAHVGILSVGFVILALLLVGVAASGRLLRVQASNHAVDR
jgi:hypothetical protein